MNAKLYAEFFFWEFQAIARIEGNRLILEGTMKNGDPFKVIRYIVNDELVQVSFEYQYLVMLSTNSKDFFLRGMGNRVSQNDPQILLTVNKCNFDVNKCSST